jgi:cytochrome c oxidase cbb3-type subunit 3
MMYRAIGSVVLAMALGSVGAAAQGTKKPAGAVPREKAIELYTANCQICHGPEGKGTPLMKDSAFLKRKWKHGTTPEAMQETIANGVPGTMMLPFKGKMSPDEIAALASLVRSYDTSLKPVRPPVKK